MKQTNFTHAYLKSLHLLKQNEDQDIEQKEVLSENDDEEVEDEIEVDVTDDQESTDSDENEDDNNEDNEDQPTCFCFKTTNQNLIDAINSGFEEVVFFVKATDGEGQDTITEVKFTADDFEDFEECECDEDEEGQEETDQTEDIPEDEEFGDVEEGQEESSDNEDTTFESVFKKYYNSLISEGNNRCPRCSSCDVETEYNEQSDSCICPKCGEEYIAPPPEEITIDEDSDVCPECGKEPCECEKDEEITECGDVCPECGEKNCTCQSVEEDKITKKTVKSAQEVQKLIEKDFGKKSKPWDLKQVKKVAFKNGKLFAASADGKKWFNKQNKPIEL